MNESGTNEIGAEHGLIRIRSVGVVRNQSKDPSWGGTLSSLDWRERATQMRAQQESSSELIVDPGLDGILDGIDGFSHIMVIYWAHLVPPERRQSTIRVHPIGNKDFPLVGVFATGSPVRPNSILATVVKLIKREGNVLNVTGLDALDGSPILDIKPHMTDHQDAGDVTVPEWMRRIHDEFS